MIQTAAILLSAGFGTRLKPLTDEIPKPAIPFLGKPMVWYAMNALQKAGIRNMAANVHHLPDKMSQVLQACAGSLQLPEIQIFCEKNGILGTGGGARSCMDLLPKAEHYIIYHGDVLCGADISQILDSHFTSQADVTMVVAPRPEHSKLGMVGIDNHHQVCRIRDWYRKNMDAQTDLMPCCFTGIHVIRRSILEKLPLNQNTCLVTEVYPQMMAEDLSINACLIQDFFADIGTPETYLDAQREVLNHPQKLPGTEIYQIKSTRGITIHEPVFISPDVEIPLGVEIGPNVCLSHGAEIFPKERLAETMRFSHYKLSMRSI